MNGSPLVRHSYRLATAGPDGLRLLIFLQPLGRALKNQNAAPTTPPCFSRWLRSSSLLFESSRRTVNRSLLLDIPTGWEPRAKQSRTVALLAALCAAALFESSPVAQNESPAHASVSGILGATGRIRTSGLPGRSRTLYPAELRSLIYEKRRYSVFQSCKVVNFQ